MKIKLYTIKGCANCELVKEHLNKVQIKYTLIDGDKNVEETVTAIKNAGSDILPLICYDYNNYIIGYDKENINKLINLYKNYDRRN